MNPITNKTEMYARLAAGEFGNTTPQWFCWQQWYADLRKLSPRHTLNRCRWGVRDMRPGGKAEMHVAACEVPSACIARGGWPYNISPMLDDLTTVRAMLQVWDGLHIAPGMKEPVQLVIGPMVQMVPHPPPGMSWRELMPSAPEYSGPRAVLMLKQALNPNSYADLMHLMNVYPGHVIELSACETCIGTVPGRNAVCWEVRGAY